MAIVDVILSVAIHRVGGIRPSLVEYYVLRSGKSTTGGRHAVHSHPGFPNDRYGAGITSDVIGEHGPLIAEAQARAELLRFLMAAHGVQPNPPRVDCTAPPR